MFGFPDIEVEDYDSCAVWTMYRRKAIFLTTLASSDTLGSTETAVGLFSSASVRVGVAVLGTAESLKVTYGIRSVLCRG